ncbi:DUF1473 family protein (plasmid) [Borreliella californiensis]|uniref:Uncharacterized protein n=1 Tax=Borreliella californiensis TaxID=373543 RepID=A0A7W9ZLN5_9SPIR|nr:DUF1473 family protein [Borreliella californiensis]MBB6213817.1 hypothetical protein [Borreliella californiensis]
MKKGKRSFDDYVAYFSEGSLSDIEIAERLGVSRVNVWRIRQKWEKGETSVNEGSRVTISEDTFEHLLSQAFRSEIKARKIRGELDVERANLELGFIDNDLKKPALVYLSEYENNVGDFVTFDHINENFDYEKVATSLSSITSNSNELVAK